MADKLSMVLPDHPDLATLIRMWEAVSGEISHERLIDMLMRTAVEHTGAERGLLILPRDGEYRIVAEATTSVDEVIVQLRQEAVNAADLPTSLLWYVLRTKEYVLIQNTSGDRAFSDDEYIRKQHARSVLCLPLLKRTRVLGVIYLEITLTRRTFTPPHRATLRLFASAAANSLENARLYSELQTREARLRRLVSSNIVGIGIWTLDGRIVDANDAFLSILGHTRSDLAAGSMSWMELTAPEWREPSAQAIEDAKVTGSFQPFEKEYLRRDGRRVPALVGGALFDKDGNEGVAFVLDLSKSKARARLADVARNTSLGVLTTSIAHEINQPLTGIITNATTCLRMLSAEPPNLEGARATAQRTLRDGTRASNVTRRFCDLFPHRPSTAVQIDLNDAAREVVALAASELKANRVVVEVSLDESLPQVRGDRVQLQQVILNLIVNAADAMKTIEDRPRQLHLVTSGEIAGELRLSVRDCGVGIDPTHAEKLFEPFHAPSTDGISFGLSISRSIIENHGGRLWAAANKGPGATFSFALPADP